MHSLSLYHLSLYHLSLYHLSLHQHSHEADTPFDCAPNDDGVALPLRLTMHRMMTGRHTLRKTGLTGLTGSTPDIQPDQPSSTVYSLMTTGVSSHPHS